MYNTGSEKITIVPYHIILSHGVFMSRLVWGALGFGGGLVIGHADERIRSRHSQRDRVVLSERIDSVAATAEHDIFVIEDRLGYLEERLHVLETSK